jgi:hypothetical protein
MSQNRFTIDFFELSFLVEACIPPTPIARHSLWLKVIDTYYEQLSQNKRDRLFEWVNRHGRMQGGIENKNSECLLFNARFDKENQITVKTKFGTFNCFKWKNKYYLNSKTFINKDTIIK